MTQIILSGDRPSGPLHLGHYIGSLKNRLMFQGNHTQYCMIADVQSLTDNFENPEKVSSNIIEVAKDYLSVGIDPDQTTIFLQSQIPEICELTIYYLNLVTLGRLERNPTVKTEIKQKGYTDSLPMGFLCYPVNQAADITIFKADLVPVGEDQIPMIEQTNEIVRKFNSMYKTNILKECKPILTDTPRLSGIDGLTKASKSLKNCIFLKDSSDQVKDKVFKMYTDPEHLQINSPGRVEGNVVFQYLDAFYSNEEEIADLKYRYQKGGLGDVSLKKLLTEVLNQFLDPIRKKRSIIEDEQVYEILKKGTKCAREIAIKTIQEIRKDIGLMCF